MGDSVEAEQALVDEDWARARSLWQQLACQVPQDRHFRAQLGYARAGELMAAGDKQRAAEELDRVLRLEPQHAAARAMLDIARPPSVFGRLFRR